MIPINRKLIEDYFDKEWGELFSHKALNLLIELTCQAYHLNQPIMPGNMKPKELPKIQKLGEL